MDVQPTLYVVRQMNSAEYSPLLVHQGLPVQSFLPYADTLQENLQKTLAELFDFSIPFKQCTSPEPCTYCDFKELCRR